MADVTPPDGHWHRRSEKPIQHERSRRWYGCQVGDCDWQVLVLPDKTEIRFPPGSDRKAITAQWDPDDLA